VTAVYVLLWLISSSAWADAVMKIKAYTDPKEYFDDDEYACECGDGPSTTCVRAESCDVTNYGNYATLNVSIVSETQFLNVMFTIASLCPDFLPSCFDRVLSFLYLFLKLAFEKCISSHNFEKGDAI